jgi:pimeloyl-ACP methyl ester carboxylesterase
MRHEVIHWSWDGRDLSVGLSRGGRGATILLLPALSSISTRRELEPLQERLSQSFHTIAVDWPGFGDLPRPYVDWRPETYRAFLIHLLARVAVEPAGIVAAGHAAGYVLKHFAEHGGGAGRLVLLSPTWRGPLPTMAGGQRPLFSRIARAVDRPVLGPALYRLNVNRLIVGMMARGHVYADRGWLNGPRMQAKLAVTRAPGARHGSARFVTGCLDPFSSRDDQLQAARQISVPVLSLFSEAAPTKSRLEMETLAALPSVSTVRLPRGKLSFYEEFPADAGEAIRAFLMGTPDVDGVLESIA